MSDIEITMSDLVVLQKTCKGTESTKEDVVKSFPTASPATITALFGCGRPTGRRVSAVFDLRIARASTALSIMFTLTFH
jgi:hypothetical protein